MRKTGLSTYEKGLLGEKIAAEYLIDLGMVLLEKRYHSPYGEIDLIMQDNDVVAFVEVKARPRGLKGSGMEAVTVRKQLRMIKTAACYIAQHQLDVLMRFDVLEITSEGLVYIRNAFEAESI